MKTYPSIPSFHTLKSKRRVGLDLYTFQKMDGSNMRFEWSKKRGWYKFGTRRRLLDATDKTFGEVIPLFMEAEFPTFTCSLAEEVANRFKELRYERATIFCEFWGHKSFAGCHEKNDPKYLTPFDVLVYRKGMLPPKEFINEFADLMGPIWWGLHRWNYDFIQNIKTMVPDGDSLQAEGVIGKVVIGRKIHRFKLKSQWWYDKVLERYGKEEGSKIANS